MKQHEHFEVVKDGVVVDTYRGSSLNAQEWEAPGPILFYRHKVDEGSLVIYEYTYKVEKWSDEDYLRGRPMTKKKSKREVARYAAHAWDAVKVIEDAVETSPST